MSSLLQRSGLALLDLLAEAPLDEIRGWLSRATNDSDIFQLLNIKPSPRDTWWSDDPIAQVRGLRALVAMLPLQFRQVGRPDVGDVVSVVAQSSIGELTPVLLERFVEMTGWSEHYTQQALRDAKTAGILLSFRGKYDPKLGHRAVTRYRITDPARWDLKQLKARKFRVTPLFPAR